METINVEEETLEWGSIDSNKHLKKRKIGPLSASEVLLSGVISISGEQRNPLVEFDTYLQEVGLGIDDNPLIWWKHNFNRFPYLAQIARQYLAIPATSAPAERIFSAAGLIVSDRRARLKPTIVDQLLFLNKNM